MDRKNDGNRTRNASRSGRVGKRPGVNDMQAKSDLKMQTPRNRRNARREKIEKTSRGDFSNVRPGKSEYKVKTAKKTNLEKKRRAGALFARVLLFLLMTGVIFGLCALAFAMYLRSGDNESVPSVRMYYYMKGEEYDEYTRVSGSDYYRDGVYWLDLRKIAKEFSFTITGDDRGLRFIPDYDTGEFIAFSFGSPNCNMNGTQVALERVPILTDENFYVPKSFVDEYFKNMTVKTDEKTGYLHIELDSEYDEFGKLVAKKIEFSLKGEKPMQTINEDELPQSVRDRTYFEAAIPYMPGMTESGLSDSVDLKIGE